MQDETKQRNNERSIIQDTVYNVERERERDREVNKEL